jgi:hypothetical protein
MNNAIINLEQEKLRIESSVTELHLIIQDHLNKLRLCQNQEAALELRLSVIECQITDIKCRTNEYKQLINSGKFDIMLVINKDLAILEPEIIHQIVKIRYGLDRYPFYDRNGLITDMKEEDYIKFVIKQLQHTSCRYCKSVFHIINACPILATKQCKLCREFGHDALHCKKLELLRK